MKRKPHLLLIATAFALLALALSLDYSRTRGFTALDDIYKLDPYIGYAFSLASGIGFHDCHLQPNDYHCAGYFKWETAHRVPGYHIYLAGNILLFGFDSPLVPIRLLQSVLIGLVVFMACVLAGRTAGNTAAVVTGLILVLDPILLHFASFVQSEAFYTFLLLLTIAMVAYARRPDAVFAAGIALGALLMTRSAGILIPALLLIFYRPRRSLALLLVGTALVLLPWIVRNYVTFQHFIPFGTEGGITLWGANNAKVYGIDLAGVPSGRWDPTDAPIPDNLTELETDAYLRQETIKFLQTVPLPRLIWALSAKLVGLTGVAEGEGLPFYLLAGGLVVGLGAAFKRRQLDQVRRLLRQRVILLCTAVLGATVLMALVAYGDARFRAVIDPSIAILAASGFALAFNRLHVDQHDYSRLLPAVRMQSVKTQWRRAAPILVPLVVIAFGYVVGGAVVSSQVVQSTAGWLREHVADHTRLAAESKANDVVEMTKTRDLSWDWRVLDVIGDV